MNNLLVVFKDDRQLLVEHVSDWGIVKANNDLKSVFHFVKDDVRSFIPVENVVYFGEAAYWTRTED